MKRPALAGMMPLIATASLLFAEACSTSEGGGGADAIDTVPRPPATWRAGGAPGAGSDNGHGWLEAFADPTLDALIAEAQDKNPDLRVAAAAAQEALALARQAGAALAPSVAGSIIADGAGDGPDVLGGFQVSWEPDLWGRLRAGRDAAAASALALEADDRAARQAVAAGVARAYFLGVEGRLQAAAARDIVAALARTSEIVNVQHREGLATAQDVALVRSELAVAQERLTAVELGHRDAIRALELLVGRYPAADLELPHALPPPPPQPPADLPSALLERRPDIVAAERRVAAAVATLDRARVARLPTLSLTATGGGASSDLSGLLDPANIAWQAAAQLLAPLFDGGRRRAGIAASGAAVDQAAAAYAGAALNAFAEVEQALDRGAALAGREIALDTALREAEEALRIAELRLREGEVSLLDVLNVRQRAVHARTALLSVRRERLTQVVDLHLALGGSY